MSYDLVAVTADTEGVAHTYMAAEALEKSAEALGTSIKVETIGAKGARNVLSTEDISSAKGVIVASDEKLDMERFMGKPLLYTGISDGINKAEELIKKAVSAPVYNGGEIVVQRQKSGGMNILFSLMWIMTVLTFVFVTYIVWKG